jgi:hypothetical protein
MVPEDNKLNYSFALGVEFRDRAGKFTTGGDCGHPSATELSPDKMLIGCGVDCDGGGLSIELANSDKSTLVRIDHVAISNAAKPGEERDDFDGGADDREFRLDRVELEQCRPLIDDAEPPAAM